MISTSELTNPVTGRLTTGTVQQLHALLGGDPVTEEIIMTFIACQYGAKNLSYVTEKAARAILARPVEFTRAAKRFAETELPF